MSHIINFSAGPSILPKTVFEQASQAVLDLNGSGLSILEISHRSSYFEPILHEAGQLVRELLGLSDDFEVLFLGGGASTQFFMTVMNLLPEGRKAAYVDTGVWSAKAIHEAKMLGEIDVIASSKDKNYSYIPKGFDISPDYQYLHTTSNNTIYGTQWQNWPDSPIPMVCDMSSDIFSKPIEPHRFGLIYAGAQKNLGPAGVTLVIVRKDVLGKVNKILPTMLRYETHAQNDSMYNTPPVFPIYVSMLTLRWLRDLGGLGMMQSINERKAKYIYDIIDTIPFYIGHSLPEDRSRMNVTWNLEDREFDKEFLTFCQDAGCDGLKGHKSVGGFRASIYNAMSEDGVKVLAEVMKEFALKHA
ncbi:MAG: 3-phosphoserine/phosphohydroxythreonine transaminase [Bacteroidota bacterium]|nr:3-phosphoserine/phosphohydroxythreonine transaminase [Bacteroidota bacterium]